MNCSHRMGFVCALIGLVLGSSLGMGQEKVSKTTNNNSQVLEALEQVIDLEFSEMPFEKVMATLSKQTGMRFILDMSARDDSLTEDEPIRFKISGVRLSTALRLMLREKNATYSIHDGVMKIISLDVASDPEFFRLQTFDCRKLLTLIEQNEKKFPSGTASAFSGSNLQGGFGGGGKSGGVFNVASELTAQQGLPGGSKGSIGGGLGGGGNQAGNRSSNQVRVATPAPASILLIDLIKASVAPDNWDDTNGDGTIQPIGGLLVVSSTEKILHDVSELLTDLTAKFGPVQSVHEDPTGNTSSTRPLGLPESSGTYGVPDKLPQRKSVGKDIRVEK